jgi:hypothetical protein
MARTKGKTMGDTVGVGNGTGATIDTGGGASAPDTTGSFDTSSIDAEITQMNQAFAFATAANIAITIAKTIDNAELTASQQRPQ